MSSNSLDPAASKTAPQSHHGIVLKGFEIMALAATFLAAIQSQVMSTTIGVRRGDETPALRAVNALFLSGLLFSLMSAFLAFLTSRWLQRLTDEERAYLQEVFVHCQNGCSRSQAMNLDKRPLLVRFIHQYFAYSLFAPMLLLVIGVFCMTAGLLTLAWSEHSLVVAITLTATCVVLLPFPVGVFLIGREPSTRKAIIELLSKKQGDW